jgi:hypothetical protein
MIINPIKVEDRTPIVIKKNTKTLIIGTMISYRGRFLNDSNGPIDPGYDYFYPNMTQNYLWEWLFDIFLPHSNKPVKERTKNEKEDLCLLLPGADQKKMEHKKIKFTKQSWEVELEK